MINPKNPFHMQAIGKVRQGGQAPFWTHYDCVKIFHEATMRQGLNVIGDIREAAFSKELIEGRMKLIDQEVNKELFPVLQSIANNRYASLEQKAEVLDGIVDAVYVLLGLAVSMGLPFNEGFVLVQIANMSKIGFEGPLVWEENNLHGEPAGKLRKPEGWTAPPMFELVKEFYTQATIIDEHQRPRVSRPLDQEPQQSGSH